MRKIILLALLAMALVVSLVAFAACKDEEAPPVEEEAPPVEESAPPKGLEDTRWILESYGEPENLNAVLEGTEINAIFGSALVRVHGSAGCNSYSGKYQSSDSKLSIPFPLVISRIIVCSEPEGINEQELQYLEALQAAESYQIQDGKLRISCGTQILVFSTK
jgi:heat shock protein HslJ